MPLTVSADSLQKLSKITLDKVSELIRPETSQFSTGLHIGKQNIVLAEFECKKDENALVNLACEKTNSSPERNAEILARFFSNPSFQFKRVCVSVPRESAVVRVITFPAMEEKQLRSSIEFEAEKYVPFNLSEIYFDCQPIRDKSEKAPARQMKVLLAACKRDVIMNLIHLIQKSHGQVDVINIDSLACLNAFLRVQSKTAVPASALLDIGTNVSNLSLLENNKIIFLRDISFGGSDLTQVLVKNLKITPEEAEAIKSGVESQTAPNDALLKSVVDKIIHEVKITIHYVEGQMGKSLNLKELHLAGGTAKNPVMQGAVRDLLGLEPKIWDPLKDVKISSRVSADLLKELETLMPVSAGLAL